MVHLISKLSEFTFKHIADVHFCLNDACMGGGAGEGTLPRQALNCEWSLISFAQNMVHLINKLS